MSLSIQYAMFHPNGEPLRAFVELELAQAEPTSPVGQAQNPTTRGTAGHQSPRRPGRRLAAVDRLRVLPRPHELASDRRGKPHRRSPPHKTRHLPDDPEARGRMSATAQRTTRRALLDPRRRRGHRRTSGQARPRGARPQLPAPPRRVHAGGHLSARDAGDRSTSTRSTIGSHLEIKLGAREELTTTTLFEGAVVSLDVEFGPGSVELLVRGFDGSHALQRSAETCAPSRTRPRATSSRGSSATPSFDITTDPSGDPYDFVQQDNETDWDFIWRLAERIGFEFVVEDGTAHFRRQTQRPKPDRAGMAEDAPLVQPPRHRDPAGQGGDARRPGPEDQGGDRRERATARTRSPRSGSTVKRSAKRSTGRASTSRPSRSPATPRHRPSLRRCSTSSPTPTSAPRACATATPGSRREPRSRSPG